MLRAGQADRRSTLLLCSCSNRGSSSSSSSTAHAQQHSMSQETLQTHAVLVPEEMTSEQQPQQQKQVSA
jgi:hypothetical protein